MSRPKRSEEAALSWDEIGKLVGMSGSQARRYGVTALRKLRLALEARGVTVDVFIEYLHQKALEEGRYHDSLSAHLDPATPPKDDSDRAATRPLSRLR